MDITNFKEFVNSELPRRLSINVPLNGNLDANKYLKTTGVGLEVETVSTVDGGNTSTITQENHEFTLLTPIYFDTTDGVNIWKKAKADAAETLGTHIVIQVEDENSFNIAMSGRYSILNELSPGNYYFTSSTSSGVLTSIEPGWGYYSNPMIFVESASFVHILPYRPSVSSDLDLDELIDDAYTLTFKKARYIITEEQSTDGYSEIILSWPLLTNTERIIHNGLLLNDTEDYTIDGDVDNPKVTFIKNEETGFEVIENDVIVVQGILNNGYRVDFEFYQFTIDEEFLLSVDEELNRWEITLTQIPVEDSLIISWNRKILDEGPDLDYQVADTTVFLYGDSLDDLAVGDIISIKYGVQ